MASGSNSVHFQKKILIGWAILGLVFGLGILIYEMISPSGSFNGIGEIIANVIVLIPGMVGAGGLCFLLEGLIICGGRFSEVTHSQWVWYVYPVFFPVTLAFGWVLSLLTSK
ncbi:MAG: hypothetical protein AUK43_00085 [Oscillatoriales cyanobacterium CG2_30_40_61]|nr:MAG: hypothetical protein AUK43_00085 [Oscillatoriales cyanobacterium CG2_30_40_61]